MGRALFFVNAVVSGNHSGPQMGNPEATCNSAVESPSRNQTPAFLKDRSKPSLTHLAMSARAVCCCRWEKHRTGKNQVGEE